jgi:hypothetical protein
MHNNSAGIDVSKGKCMVAVMRSFGEIVAKPYEVSFTESELWKLADSLGSVYARLRNQSNCDIITIKPQRS